MPTSCRTHDYDGTLREKWFAMRPMLLEKYLPQCLSFDKTINEMEEWLKRKYSNVKRIGRARRAIDILRSERTSNFDSRNEIDVEELLPLLWNQVKSEDDMHDTFYEQLCDIPGGSCSQGRSTRLFQFLFVFDCLTEPSIPASTDEPDKQVLATEQGSMACDTSVTTLDTGVSVTDERHHSAEQEKSQTQTQESPEREEHIQKDQPSDEERQCQSEVPIVREEQPLPHSTPSAEAEPESNAPSSKPE